MNTSKSKTDFVLSILLFSMLTAFGACSHDKPVAAGPAEINTIVQDSIELLDQLDTTFAGGYHIRLTMFTKTDTAGIGNYAILEYTDGKIQAADTLETWEFGRKLMPIYYYKSNSCEPVRVIFENGLLAFSLEGYQVTQHHLYQINKGHLQALPCKDAYGRTLKDGFISSAGLLYKAADHSFYGLFVYRGTNDHNVEKWTVKNGRASCVKTWTVYGHEFDDIHSDFCGMRDLLAK